MDTVDIPFSCPTIAAVSMPRGPWCLRSFAATIRQSGSDEGFVCVTGRYNFKTSPGFLGFPVGPVVQLFFRRETSRRRSALERFVERDRPRRPTSFNAGFCCRNVSLPPCFTLMSVRVRHASDSG